MSSIFSLASLLTSLTSKDQWSELPLGDPDVCWFPLPSASNYFNYMMSKIEKLKIDVQSLWKHQISRTEARRAEGSMNHRLIMNLLMIYIMWTTGPPVRSASLDVHLRSDDFSINWCLLGAIFTLAHNQHNRRERSTALTFPVDPLLQWTIILVISCSVGTLTLWDFTMMLFSVSKHTWNA